MSLKHYMSYDESDCAPCKTVPSYQPNNNAFCLRVPFAAMTDPCKPTLNKALAGCANPRTLVKPTIAPPSHAIENWRQNPNVTHSQINRKMPLNPSWAGFGVPENATGKNAGDANCSRTWDVEPEIQIESDYLNSIQPEIYTATNAFQPINANLGISMTPQFPNTTYSSDIGDNQIFYDTNRKTYAVKEEPFKCLKRGDDKCQGGKDHDEDDIDVLTVARPKSADADPSPPCEIAFQPYPEAMGPDYVYDGRFTGYGASDRSYVDAQLGAPRFYYDDINAIRMPNYITRSKIDSCATPFGDAYGKLDSGHLSLAEAKLCAEQSWHINSLDFRTNLSKSLMRKVNEENVQRRQAPKYTIYRA